MNDPEFVLEAIRVNPFSLLWAPRKVVTKDMLREAIVGCVTEPDRQRVHEGKGGECDLDEEEAEDVPWAQRAWLRVAELGMLIQLARQEGRIGPRVWKV